MKPVWGLLSALAVLSFILWYLLHSPTDHGPRPALLPADQHNTDSAVRDVQLDSQDTKSATVNFDSDSDDSPMAEVASDFDLVLEKSSFKMIHQAFKEEVREESWASAMESGIKLHVAKSDAMNWATVQEVECRASICEVRGYMPDSMENPDLDPGSMLAGNFGDGWWQGSVGSVSSQHTYDGENVTRFVLFIAESDKLLDIVDALKTTYDQ